MRYIDANIFIRYITGDIPEILPECTDLFQQLHDGDQHVATSEIVISEIIYVLTSPKLYGLSCKDSVDRLKPLIELRGIHIPHKQTVCFALDLYADDRKLDFADALKIAHMQRLGIAEIYSYDRHFDRYKSYVLRVEPKI